MINHSGKEYEKYVKNKMNGKHGDHFQNKTNKQTSKQKKEMEANTQSWYKLPPIAPKQEVHLLLPSLYCPKGHGTTEEKHPGHLLWHVALGTLHFISHPMRNIYFPAGCEVETMSATGLEV